MAKLPKVSEKARAAAKGLVGKMRAGLKYPKKIGRKSPSLIKIGGTQHNRKEAASFIKEHRKARREGREPSTTNIYGWRRRGPTKEQRKQPFIDEPGGPVTGAAGYNRLMTAYGGARKQQKTYYDTTRGSYKRTAGAPVDYGKAKDQWMRKFLRSASANLSKRRAANKWRNEHVKGGKATKMHEAWQKRKAMFGRTGRKTG